MQYCENFKPTNYTMGCEVCIQLRNAARPRISKITSAQLKEEFDEVCSNARITEDVADRLWEYAKQMHERGAYWGNYQNW